MRFVSSFSIDHEIDSSRVRLLHCINQPAVTISGQAGSRVCDREIRFSIFGMMFAE
jgi:hypothetical protein